MIPLEPLFYVSHIVHCSRSREASFVLAPAILFFCLLDFPSLNEIVVQDKKIFLKLRTGFTHEFQIGCSSSSSASSTTPDLFCAGGKGGFKRFSETFLNLH